MRWATATASRPAQRPPRPRPQRPRPHAARRPAAAGHGPVLDLLEQVLDAPPGRAPGRGGARAAGVRDLPGGAGAAGARSPGRRRGRSRGGRPAHRGRRPAGGLRLQAVRSRLGRVGRLDRTAHPPPRAGGRSPGAPAALASGGGCPAGRGGGGDRRGDRHRVGRLRVRVGPRPGPRGERRSCRGVDGRGVDGRGVDGRGRPLRRRASRSSRGPRFSGRWTPSGQRRSPPATWTGSPGLHRGVACRRGGTAGS